MQVPLGSGCVGLECVRESPDIWSGAGDSWSDGRACRPHASAPAEMQLSARPLYSRARRSRASTPSSGRIRLRIPSDSCVCRPHAPALGMTPSTEEVPASMSILYSRARHGQLSGVRHRQCSGARHGQPSGARHGRPSVKWAPAVGLAFNCGCRNLRAGSSQREPS